MSDTPSATKPLPDSYGYGYRPLTYRTPETIDQLIIGSIKGSARRKAVKRILEEKGDEGLNNLQGLFLTQHALTEEERVIVGQLHPSYMSGEYLPDLADDEYEIARVRLDSVLGDVTSVRARYTKEGIVYSVCDEYSDGEGHIWILPQGPTRTPISTLELIGLIDGSRLKGDVAATDGGIVYSNVIHQHENGLPQEEIRTFITVDSEYYPSLGLYYADAVDDWLDRHSETDADEEIPDDPDPKAYLIGVPAELAKRASKQSATSAAAKKGGKNGLKK